MYKMKKGAISMKTMPKLMPKPMPKPKPKGK